MQLSDKSQHIQQMFDRISGRYDFLNRLLSFRQDVRWRRRLVKMLPRPEHFLHEPSLCLFDVACGTGDVIFSVAKKRKEYQNLVGFDISQGMLTQAELKQKAEAASSQKIQFVLSSAESLTADSESAHAVTIAFGLRNVENRMQALHEFHRVLKKGGSLFVLEFFPTSKTVFTSFFDFYFKRVLPCVASLFSDKEAYSYLPNSVGTMPTGDEFQNMLLLAGFSRIEQVCWMGGAVRLFTCLK